MFACPCTLALFSPSLMKILRIVLRILLGLLLLMPILGVTGVFPAPTADLYTPDGWAFMSALMNAGYLMPLLGIVFAVVLLLTIMNRMALAAIILAPVAVNIICFHAFVDTGLISPSASLGIPLFLINAFFLWDNRKKYKGLW
jgi:putative oxidoreductase